MLRLENVFERFRLANLKLKPSKCKLCQAQVEYLGHIISDDGVRTDPSKIVKIKNWPVPRNVHDLRRFLGLASYYRRFIKGFSEIAAPLNKLISKEK